MRITAITIIFLIAVFLPAWCDASQGLRSPHTYVLEKIDLNHAVFLGTTHQQPAILDFITQLLPKLPNHGVTHIALEIASDQQHRIDTYISTGAGLSDIALVPAIDCAAYRNLLKVLHDMLPAIRPAVKAIDLPQMQYNNAISRDEYMAAELARLFGSNGGAKVLVILGSLHVLHMLDWQAHVPNAHLSLRTYLKRTLPDLKVCSIVNIVSATEKACDFSRTFGSQPGAVAMDLDERFKGWHLGLTQNIAIRQAQPHSLVDGIIVY